MAGISFVAYGTPQPKGSARAFVPKGWTRAVVTSANPNLKAWQGIVAAAAQAVAGAPIDGPVSLRLAFTLARPKSLPKRVQAHTKKPDLDKLVRAVKDAITGVCYRDDAQVVRLMATKQYGVAPSVAVVVEEDEGV